jgi:hypothetical protein
MGMKAFVYRLRSFSKSVSWVTGRYWFSERSRADDVNVEMTRLYEKPTWIEHQLPPQPGALNETGSAWVTKIDIVRNYVSTDHGLPILEHPQAAKWPKLIA